MQEVQKKFREFQSEHEERGTVRKVERKSDPKMKIQTLFIHISAGSMKPDETFPSPAGNYVDELCINTVEVGVNDTLLIPAASLWPQQRLIEFARLSSPLSVLCRGTEGSFNKPFIVSGASRCCYISCLTKGPFVSHIK